MRRFAWSCHVPSNRTAATARCVIAMTTVFVAACGSASTGATGNSGRAESSSSPTPTSDPLAHCPAVSSFDSLTTVARMPAADDLAAAPDGTLWISDASSTIEHVGIDGTVLQQISDPRAPEGIVALSDGNLIVAEQRPDRIVRLDPGSQQVTVLLQLTPRSGSEGVDGIGYDATRNAILVPDSPNGTLLEVSLADGKTTQLASGLGRPAGAARRPDGSIAVASENKSGLWRVPAGGGTPQALGAATQGDDVDVVRGAAYVTSLDSKQVVAIDARTGRTVTLVDHLANPQGLAVLRDGRIAVADSTAGRVGITSGC
ncbi:MAG: hypothetical protein ABR498_06845 [Candidatus Dormibacteria bacterium]